MYSLILIYLIGILVAAKAAIDSDAYDKIDHPSYFYLIVGLAWPMTMWIILLTYKRP